MIDNGQPQSDQAPPPGGESYEICITVSPNGLTVSKEQLEPDEGQEAKGQPAGSIAEALKLALAIYQQSSAGSAEDNLQSGFNNPNQPNQPNQAGNRPPMGGM